MIIPVIYSFLFISHLLIIQFFDFISKYCTHCQMSYNAFMNERPNPAEPDPTDEVFRLNGRVLYLTQDPQLIRDQMEGKDLPAMTALKLLNEISTDEIIPNRVCLRYTGHEERLLGDNVLTGLRGNVIKTGEIIKGGFEAIVAGSSFGRGSSRYHAPLSLQEAGIKVLIVEPERIFSENCVNAGIYTLSHQSEIALKLLEKGGIPIEDLIASSSSVSQEIMRSGSLLSYLKSLNEGKKSYPIPNQTERPMTMVEKLIARRTHTSNDLVGVSFVKPGDEVIVQPNKYYGYELQTTVVRKALEKEFGPNIPIKNPDKITLFNDHTALLDIPEAQIQQSEQKVFAEKYGIVNFENDDNGSPAICHTKMVEDIVLPGEVILGNDSHTCTLGAVNSLAVGKGAADLAGAIAYDKMVLKVPETIRINLTGKLRNGATTKDAVLTIGAREDMKENRIASTRVLEFGGEALSDIPFNEQLKFTNMAIELQAFTGIIEPNVRMFEYLMQRRGVSFQELAQLMIISDGSCNYFEEIDIDLSSIEPTVATPGDTQNGVPLSEVRLQEIKIHKAYVGSCTHGTPEDLKLAAEVLHGRKIAEGVNLYVQASSVDNRVIAENEGYIKTLIESGAELLPIGCGACMNAGPGSTEEDEVGIFATNRNFPGRTGRGITYLANPAVVAASAVKGFICGPDDLENL